MFEEIDYQCYDISIKNDINNASKVSFDITSFALTNKVDNKDSQLLGLITEEMVSNIISYGYKKAKSNYIDINLKISDDLLLLRIRDDGLPFDPTKYEFDNDEKYLTSGIQMIKKLSNKMSYMRILNMNNTIIEMNYHKEN